MSRAQLSSGSFRSRFADELAARAAARDARSVGFVVEIEDEPTGGWLTVSRRRQPFAPDDASRYASRLRTIASEHGGAYEAYVEETPV
jgi:hypothetical protein